MYFKYCEPSIFEGSFYYKKDLFIFFYLIPNNEKLGMSPGIELDNFTVIGKLL